MTSAVALGSSSASSSSASPQLPLRICVFLLIDNPRKICLAAALGIVWSFAGALFTIFPLQGVRLGDKEEFILALSLATILIALGQSRLCTQTCWPRRAFAVQCLTPF